MGGKTLQIEQLVDWDITVNADALPPERYAAEEFQRFFAQATSIQLPIRYFAPEDTQHVYVSPSAALQESGL